MLKKQITHWSTLVFSLLLISILSGCGYNEFQTKDEATKAAWSEVVNQYQR
ncbi:MAG: LemA family protein, partial [Herbaspirillum sp.]